MNPSLCTVSLNFSIRVSASVLYSVSLAGLIHASAATAQDQVWLIGSGPDVFNAEAQIETNAQWAQQVLSGADGGRRLHVFFNNGDDAAPDVKTWQRPADSPATLQPLARIYDTFYANGYSYRNHRIEPVAGPSRASTLKPYLREAFKMLQPEDKGLLFYLGHGGYGEPDRGGSYLSLWDHGQLDEKELHSYLASAPPAAEIRFVFTQCYSGGFADLIYQNGVHEPEAISGRRCGFMSVSRDQPAEGCSASLDSDDYRGYSTYFLAALDGRHRDGSPLEFPVDQDGDGRVSLLEAHLYTLRAARSTDLPRSTSEQFLLDWSPWYLHLVAPDPLPDNPYRRLLDQLADDMGLELDPDRPGPALHRARLPLREHREALEQEQDKLTGIIRRARHSISDALEQRWPAAAMAPTALYRDFLLQDLDAAQAFIIDHPLYQPLAREQDRYWSLDRAILALDRQLATLERIDHLSQLARLWDAVHGWAGEATRNAYQRLLACEDQPL